MAAFLPWAMDPTIVPGPVAASPPAKTPLKVRFKGNGVNLNRSPSGFLQALEGLHHAVCPRDSGRHKDGVERFSEIIGSDIPANALSQLDFNPHFPDDREILLDHVFGESVRGKPIGQEASHPVLGVEEGDVIAHPSQIMGCHQSGRTSPKDRHLLAILLRECHFKFCLVDVFDEELLQVANGDGTVFFHPFAFPFARVRTGVGENPRERKFISDEGQGLLEFSHRDQGHVSLGIDMERAGRPAGRDASLLNPVGAWHGLSEELVDGCPCDQPLFVIVRDLHRADL